MAIGSSKPWVHRSLRSWVVNILPKQVVLVWWSKPDPIPAAASAGLLGPKTVAVAVHPRFFNDVAIYIMFGQLPGRVEVHVGNFGGELRVCSKTDVERVFSLSPEWVDISGPTGGMRIPTSLVIEAMRILRQRQLGSSSVYVPKGRARSTKRRLKDQARKQYREVRGDHQRWTNIAKFVRLVQESNDVKEISPEQLEGRM
jgi:hypothetical protein